MRLRLLLFALVLAAALTACTDSTADEEEAQERLVSSVEATREAGSSRIALTVEEAVGESTGQQRGGGENVVRFEAEGAADFESGDSRLTFEIDEEVGEAEVRSVDGTYYVQIPGREEWIAVDPGAVLDALGDPTGLRSAVGTDPTAVLDLLRGVEQARRIGRDTVAGADTVHYTAAVDVELAARLAEGPTADALERLAGQLEGSSLPLEVWLDEDGRVVRLRIPVIVEATAGQAEPPRITTTITFTDFGTDVDVEAPPPERVVNG